MKLYLYILILTGVLLILLGCAREESAMSEALHSVSDIYVSITVHNPATALRTGTRTTLEPGDGEYTLPYTESESEINSLTLILMRVKDSGEEVFEASQTVTSLTENSNGSYQAEFNLTGISGLKHLYLGANMSQQHIAAYTTPDRVFDAGEPEEGHNIAAGALLQIDAQTGAGSNIVMTAPVTISGSTEINIQATSAGTTLLTPDPVRLVRTVSKVLMTCSVLSDNAEYVQVTDIKDHGTSSTDNAGWIRLTDVRYMINLLNRKTFLNYRLQNNGLHGTLVPNYTMSDWVEYRGEGHGRYGIKNLPLYQENFYYYSTAAMVEMLTQRQLNCVSRAAEAYDAAKVGLGSGTNHYMEGLYCTENTVQHDMGITDVDQLQNAGRLLSTHLIVLAKYTPRRIWTDDGNGNLIQNTYATEAQAAAALTGQKDSYTEYEEGTFWQDDNTKEYYSMSGMRLRLKESSEVIFNRYDGGRGYYYTLVDYKDGEDTWGVVRNHYYVLRVTEIVAPGSAFPGNDIMRIHSDVVDWVDMGGSEIEIEIPQ